MSDQHYLRIKGIDDNDELVCEWYHPESCKEYVIYTAEETGCGDVMGRHCGIWWLIDQGGEDCVVHGLDPKPAFYKANYWANREYWSGEWDAGVELDECVEFDDVFIAYIVFPIDNGDWACSMCYHFTEVSEPTPSRIGCFSSRLCPECYEKVK